MFEAVVGGITTLLAAIAARTSFRLNGSRRRLARDLDLHDRLPDSSGMKAILAELIDKQVEQLISDESIKRRNPFGVVLSLVFMIAGGGLAYLAVRSDSWVGVSLWIVAGIVFGLGISGFVIDVRRVERDDRGRPIRSPERDVSLE